ncbi:MAG: hypothetical protein IJ158_10915 [Treponema sp.]|nr:hypothetical protein [Treponema sp.]
MTKSLRPSPTALLNPRCDPSFKAMFTQGTKEANAALNTISEDERNWWIQNSIDIARRDRNSEIEAGIKKGLEKAIAQGLQQGIQQGIQQGVEQGEHNAKLEVA